VKKMETTNKTKLVKRVRKYMEKRKASTEEFSFRGMTSTQRCVLTNSATSATSKLRATKPLFPSMSGFTTNFFDDNHGCWSVSSAKSVECV